MHHIGRVEEVHRAQEVVHDRYDMTLREWVVLYTSEYAAEVLVVVFHYDEDVIESPIAMLCLLCRNYDIHKLGREQIILHLRQLAEYWYFSDDFACFVAIAENVWNLLDSDHLAGSHAPSLNDLSKTSGANVGWKLIPRDDGFPYWAKFNLLHFVIERTL